MSLANIVSGIVKKEPKVDRKKMGYFLKDFDAFKNQSFSVRILLSVQNPERIIILNAPRGFSDHEDVTLEHLQKTIGIILPDTKVTTVNGELCGVHDSNLVLDPDAEVTKEQLIDTDLGLYINKYGFVYVYKGDYVPQGVKFHVEEPTEESMKDYLSIDLDVLLPTKNMFMISDLTRNPDAEIMICHFPGSRKRDAAKQITEITSAILNSLIKTNIEIAYYPEDFNEWNYGEPTTSFMAHQYDYVLALREGRIDVHLPFDNGHLAKEPNGWLFLN